VFLWVALLGVLAKVMMRGRPISLKSMQQQQQHASMQPAAATAAAEAARGAVSCCSGALVRVMGVCVHTLCACACCVYVGACVSGCACIHVFAHNTIAWMCKFKSCVCMYVCTTHMRVACARACMRCTCSQKRNCECQNV